MSLFADYKKERENREVIENENGFIIYSFEEDYCYIVDIYVKPEMRRTKVGSQLNHMVEQICIEKGIHKVFGSVSIKANNPTESIKSCFAVGFKIHGIKDDLIILIKEV